MLRVFHTDINFPQLQAWMNSFSIIPRSLTMKLRHNKENDHCNIIVIMSWKLSTAVWPI